MTVKTLEREMEVFRLHYESVRVTVGSDNMVYKVGYGFADKAAKKANELIADLGLELVAIPTSFWRKNSFVVKSIYSSEL